MTRKIRWAFFSMMAAVLTVVGCNQAKTPAGFPETVPFTLKVVKGEKPVEGVNIVMTPDIRSNSWSVSGKTDASGMATIQTVQGDFVRAGLPVGSFKVTLTKVPDVSAMVTVVNDGTLEKSLAYNEEVTRLRAENPSEVPLFMNELTTTPVTIEVLRSVKEHTINIDDYSNPAGDSEPTSAADAMPAE